MSPRAAEIRKDIRERLKVLQEIAREDGIIYYPEIEKVFIKFVVRAEMEVRPTVYLLDNGNLQAKWKGLEGEIDLTFDQNLMINFNLIRRITEMTSPLTVTGTERVSQIVARIQESGLRALLYGQLV